MRLVKAGKEGYIKVRIVANCEYAVSLNTPPVGAPHSSVLMTGFCSQVRVRPSSCTPPHRTKNGVSNSRRRTNLILCKVSQGVSGFGEPGRVAALPGHVHSRVIRREQGCADAADHDGSQSEFLNRGLRTQAPRVHRARGCGRPLKHGRRGGEDGRILAVRTLPWLVTFVSVLL